MSVQIPNCRIGVVRSGRTKGAFGDWVVTPGANSTQALPAAKRENADGTWHLNLDPDLWPVRVKDTLLDPETGQRFLVESAQHITHPDEPDLGHIRVSAVGINPAGAEPGTVRDVGTP